MVCRGRAIGVQPILHAAVTKFVVLWVCRVGEQLQPFVAAGAPAAAGDGLHPAPELHTNSRCCQLGFLCGQHRFESMQNAWDPGFEYLPDGESSRGQSSYVPFWSCVYIRHRIFCAHIDWIGSHTDVTVNKQ